MTKLVLKRAKQLAVGDLLSDECLPYRFNQGPAQVVLVRNEADEHTFVAYCYPNGRHDSMTVRSEAALQVYPALAVGLDYSRPADSDDPQPSGGREPLHTGAVTDGGLVDESEMPPWNPETGFFQPGRVPELVGDDLPRAEDHSCPAHGAHPHASAGGACLDCDECVGGL